MNSVNGFFFCMSISGWIEVTFGMESHFKFNGDNLWSAKVVAWYNWQGDCFSLKTHEKKSSAALPPWWRAVLTLNLPPALLCMLLLPRTTLARMLSVTPPYHTESIQKDRFFTTYGAFWATFLLFSYLFMNIKIFWDACAENWSK